MKAVDKWVILNAREDAGRIILEPHSRFDMDRIQKRMKNGRGQIRASLASVRSLPQLRLYWPWVRKVVDNSNHFTTESGLHKMLLAGAGVTEPFIDIEGNITLMPSSIAFDAMDQEDFNAYFDRAQQLVAEHILPGVDLDQLMKEAKEDCGWSPPKATKPRPSSVAEPTPPSAQPSSAPQPKVSSRPSTPMSSYSPRSVFVTRLPVGTSSNRDNSLAA